MTYKLLTDYAKQFNADFPISKIMDHMNDREATETIKYCIDTNTPYGSKKKSSKAQEE